MKTKRLFNWALAAVVAGSVFVTSCKDDKTVSPQNTGEDEEYLEPYVQPVNDQIKTTFDGDVLLLGTNFDETTLYMISRIKGQKFQADRNTITIPESVRAVFIASNGDLSDEGLKELKRRYDKGMLQLLFHKPSNAELFFYMVYFLREPEAGTSPQAVRAKVAANDNSLASIKFDFVGFGPNHKLFYLPEICDPDAEPITHTATINTLREDGTKTTRDTTFVVTLPDLTPYNYGRLAEVAVKWMNQIDAPAQTRALTRGNTSEETPLATIVINSTFIGQDHVVYDSDASPDQRLYHSQKMGYYDITIRMWSDMMYNFDKDEDYYNVVTEIEAPDVYNGYWFEDKGTEIRESAFTFSDLDIRTHWPHSDYQMRDEWNLQPWGTEQPRADTQIDGWVGSAGVSIGRTGVAGKFNGGIVHLTAVTQIQNDVDLSNSQNYDGNWMRWYYKFNNQPWWSGKRGKYGNPGDPGNSACRGNFHLRQSWDWVISDTQKRGDQPFTVEWKVEAQSRVTDALSRFLETVKHEYFDAIVFNPSNLTFDLPVPERYRHIYEMTLDEIEDLAEYNNLTAALNTVSSDYNQLYNLLIRKDTDGTILGRTATTETKLKQMVGKEWYNLAQDIAGKKINVEKTYKFYVKDENGDKLQMVNDDNEEVGTYMVVAPEGISIE